MLEFKNKYCLVTGGSGMIGRSLVRKLVDKGAKVLVVSIDNPTGLPKEVNFVQFDLTELKNCLTVCDGMDYVFHLAGIKGSPKKCIDQPANFFVPTIMFNTNMLEACVRTGVNRFLYTSTIGVYAQAEILREDDVWKTFPSENDRFAGWAKRMGELQIQAYQKQYGANNIRIVRPANVYGPYDNFIPPDSMVIPSLIARVDGGESPLRVWGNGSQIRDFIYTDDCAEGILKVFESDETRPVNLGSGENRTIKEVVEIVVKKSSYKPEIVWDTTKPTGDKIRLMDVSRAKALGFKASTSLENGIEKTIKWYKNNKV